MDTFGNSNYLKSLSDKIPWHRVIETTLSIMYMVVWCLLLIWFWKGGREDISGYNVMSFVVILPLMTFAMSFYYGISRNFGIYRWMMVCFFAIMNLLLNYLTFDMVWMIERQRVMIPDWRLLVNPAILSVAGMAIGMVLRYVRRYLKKRREAEE